MFRRFPKIIRGFVVSTSQNYQTLGLKISETVSSGASLNRNDRLFQRRPHFLHKPFVNSVILFFISASIEVIATYALCGFTNFLGLGVLLGGLGPMAPSRQGDMAKIALRTLFAATIACFMTASIAGKFSELWLLKTVKTRAEITIK